GAPLRHERARVREHLDAMVERVCHVDVAAGIDGDIRRRAELAVPRSVRAPLEQEVPEAIELLDPMIAAIRDVDVSERVTGGGERLNELPGRNSIVAPG